MTMNHNSFKKNSIHIALAILSGTFLYGQPQEQCTTICQGLSTEMTEDLPTYDLKKKYRNFVLQCHPDKCTSPANVETFRKIMEMYDSRVKQAPTGGITFKNEEKQGDGADWVDLTSDKIEDLQKKLKKLKKNPNESGIKKKALALYNSLRKELGYKTAQLLSDVDGKWLKNLSDELLFLNLIEAREEKCLDDVVSELKDLADRMKVFDSKQNIDGVLETYNILRNLFQLPLATSEIEMDYSWIAGVTINNSPNAHEIKHKVKASGKFAIRHASPAMESLVHGIQKKLGIQGKILVSSYGDEETGVHCSALPHVDHKDVHYVEIGNHLNTRSLLFSIYHELGHIAHNDNIDNIWVSGRDPRKAISELLQAPALKKDLQRVNRYIELGKKAFDSTTLLGQKINTHLAREAPYESYKNLAIEQEFMLTEERRADLFALDNLFEHGEIPPILGSIEFFIQEFLNYESHFGLPSHYHQDPHPSSLERVLYIAGFLVEKNIPLNQELKKLEELGSCGDYCNNTGGLNTKESPPKKHRLRNAVLKVYEEAKRQHEAQVSL